MVDLSPDKQVFINLNSKHFHTTKLIFKSIEKKYSILVEEPLGRIPEPKIKHGPIL